MTMAYVAAAELKHVASALNGPNSTWRTTLATAWAAALRPTGVVLRRPLRRPVRRPLRRPLRRPVRRPLRRRRLLRRLFARPQASMDLLPAARVDQPVRASA